MSTEVITITRRPGWLMNAPPSSSLGELEVEITCDPLTSTPVKIGLAIKALVESGANLTGANLTGADRTHVDLTEADLFGANLSGANLSGADLSGAYLSGAEIARKVAQVRRDDGYEFIALETDIGVMVLAGCRWFSVPDFRAHVAASYPGTDKAAETLAILDFIGVRAAALGCVAPVAELAA